MNLGYNYKMRVIELLERKGVQKNRFPAYRPLYLLVALYNKNSGQTGFVRTNKKKEYRNKA